MSASTASTLFPRSARKPDRLATRVVFPTPPFELVTLIIDISLTGCTKSTTDRHGQNSVVAQFEKSCVFSETGDDRKTAPVHVSVRGQDDGDGGATKYATPIGKGPLL